MGLSEEIAPALRRARDAAAELSAGASSDAIYDAIERLIEARDLAGSVLDYGAGRGHLTRRLMALGRFTRVAAADLMPVPADLAERVQWLSQDLNAPLPDPAVPFDLIVAAEIIEHLENPRFTLRELFRWLRPGATVIVSTPNNESWRALIALLVRGHFMAFGDTCYPAHITALLRKDLTRIFEEAGFTGPDFYFTNQGGLPGKPELSWQRLSLGLLRGLRFSDNLIAVALKPAR